MTKCLQCARLDLQSRPQFSKVGAGHCPDDPTFKFVSITFERVCKAFKPAPPDTVAKRKKWAKEKL